MILGDQPQSLFYLYSKGCGWDSIKNSLKRHEMFILALIENLATTIFVESVMKYVRILSFRHVSPQPRQKRAGDQTGARTIRKGQIIIVTRIEWKTSVGIFELSLFCLEPH